ncbi:PREDICTED: C-type lectin domain family 4 member E-like [Cyprinodon variegatus]|uniref:C-type lectin domain family 4 member E-like n=1 Tax=Cyprinodon variegatus TaxID=28743 RepID=A0A3Q2EIG7_CYPVA|nr:PREDICTED: C-type lectin domain family 4 member E-like [Cyprinodon variegatus]XP_015236979.1 PREDICTED: C-type lectin domain family 4 member E-like [Cyprinodon variegatus]
MGVNNGLTLQEGPTTKASTEQCDHKPLAHYLSLLCFMLTIVTLLQTLCLVQITFTSQSRSIAQEKKLQDLTNRLRKLNQSHHLLFTQYPALSQYCPTINSSTGDRECRPCLADWKLNGDKCFYFSEDRADWISSQYRCMSLGGAVATVKTEEEQEFLFKTAQSLSQGDSYWLGLRGSGVEGTWQWSDGTPLENGPQFWYHQPDITGESNELCGRLTPADNYRRSWFISRCSGQLRRICERRQASLQ